MRVEAKDAAEEQGVSDKAGTAVRGEGFRVASCQKAYPPNQSGDVTSARSENESWRKEELRRQRRYEECCELVSCRW